MIDLLFIAMCSSPGVSPVTVKRIIEVESGYNEAALHVNGPAAAIKPKSRQQAAKIASKLIGQGGNVDLGLMQINSSNLPRYGLSVEEAFEPCRNIRLGSQILKEHYRRAKQAMGPGHRALKAALSAYNTGNFYSGATNGYLDRIFRRKVAPYKAGMVAFDAEASL